MYQNQILWVHDFQTTLKLSRKKRRRKSVKFGKIALVCVCAPDARTLSYRRKLCVFNQMNRQRFSAHHCFWPFCTRFGRGTKDGRLRWNIGLVCRLRLNIYSHYSIYCYYMVQFIGSTAVKYDHWILL